MVLCKDHKHAHTAMASPSLPPVLVYFHPTMRHLAEAIVQRCHDEEARKVDGDLDLASSVHSVSSQICRRVELRDDIEWNKFEGEW